MVNRMADKLAPVVDTVRIHDGRWLSIRVRDVDGLSADLNLYGSQPGSFGNVNIKGIDREFVEALRDRLTELLPDMRKNDAKL